MIYMSGGVEYSVISHVETLVNLKKMVNILSYFTESMKHAKSN